MGDEKNRPDGPRVEVVVQDEEVRGPVFEDGALHFGVGGVDDSGADWFALALKLEGRIAAGAEVVDGSGPLWGRAKAW